MNRSPVFVQAWYGLCVAAGLASLPAVAAGRSDLDRADGAATETGRRNLSLAEAQHAALARNWDLLAAAAGVDAATAQKIIAREVPNPTLSFSTTLINVDNHPSSTPSGNSFWDRSYDTVIAVNQLLEIGGKRRNRKLSAQAGFEEAKAQFLDAKRSLELGVTKAYLAAAQAEEDARVLLESSATLRKEATLADVRLKAGEISSSDKSQIEITADRFELDARAAESAASQARVALEVLLGVAHPSGAVLLSESLEAMSSAAIPPDTNHWGIGRPDVVAADAALRKASADVLVQKAGRVPDPTVLAQYEHEPPDMPNTVGFGLSLPLPFWNHNKGNILAAEAAREQARLALEKIQAQAAADIAVARFAYENSKKRWESYRDIIRPKSKEIRETMAYAYGRGGASLLDLLTAERGDNDVRLAATQAASDAASAIAALKAATLVIQPPEIQK